MKLEAQNVSAGYNNRRVIKEVDLKLNAGEITTILGPNGCGKSTLMRTLGRLQKKQSGELFLNDNKMESYSPRVIAGELAILTQLHHTPPDLTVEELVLLGRYPHRSNSFTFSASDREAVARAIGLTNLELLRHRKVRTLSGGERQRAWLALTLAQEPKVLLLDEPTTFLDMRCQLEIIDLIIKLKKEFDLAILLVLHDINLAATCSDRFLLLKDGTVRYVGTPDELMTPEIIADIFDIEVDVIRHESGRTYCLPLKAGT